MVPIFVELMYRAGWAHSTLEFTHRLHGLYSVHLDLANLQRAHATEVRFRFAIWRALSKSLDETLSVKAADLDLFCIDNIGVNSVEKQIMPYNMESGIRTQIWGRAGAGNQRGPGRADRGWAGDGRWSK